MNRVSVDLNSPSPYIESDSFLHRTKRRLTYSWAFRLLKRYLSSHDKLSILEVGTGAGFFQFFCAKHFQSSAIFGIEYDERLLEATRKRAPFSTCVQGNAENFDFNGHSFDIVVSFQVIEHLYNPELMLERVRSHLKPGGLFLVTTPNLNSFGARIMGSNWHGYRDDHVSLKGVEEWDNLIRSMGFKNLYSGSTFFSGIPLFNRFPLGVFNWLLLLLFGSLRWKKGESYVGLFKRVEFEKQDV